MLSNKRYSIADGWEDRSGILLLNVDADGFVGGGKALSGNSRSVSISDTAHWRHGFVPGRFVSALRFWQTSRRTFARNAGSEGDLHLHGLRDASVELAQGQTVHDDQDALRFLDD